MAGGAGALGDIQRILPVSNKFVDMLGAILLVLFAVYVALLMLLLPQWLKNAIELVDIFGLLLFICMGIVYPYFFIYYVVVRMPDEHPVWSFFRCFN